MPLRRPHSGREKWLTVALFTRQPVEHTPLLVEAVEEGTLAYSEAVMEDVVFVMEIAATRKAPTDE